MRADYFVVGFWTNRPVFAGPGVHGGALADYGPDFGVIRGEGLTWRKNPVRAVRQYMLATWIITILMLLRLAVQMPLYFINAVRRWAPPA